MNAKLTVRFASIAFLLPFIANAQAARTNFTDVETGAWYADYVNMAANEGIVNGYTDARGNLTGKFGPADHVTVAEALKIAIRGSDHKPATSMGGAYWVLPYMDYAFDHNFAMTKGQSGLDFQRDATRAEVASLIADAFGVDQETPVGNRYDDVTASTTYAFAVEALSRDDILTGDMDMSGQSLNRFRPTDSVNRAETVKMVMEARAKYLNDQSASVSSAPASSSSSAQAHADWQTYTNADFSYQIRYPSSATVTASGSSFVTMQTKDGSVTIIALPESGGALELVPTIERQLQVEGKTYTAYGSDEIYPSGQTVHAYYVTLDTRFRFEIRVPQADNETKGSLNVALSTLFQMVQTFESTKK